MWWLGVSSLLLHMVVPFLLCCKNLRLKCCLRDWNYNIFFVIFFEMLARENLRTIQNIIASYRLTEDRFDEEFVAKTTVERIFLERRARVNWLTKGDCNTAFFMLMLMVGLPLRELLLFGIVIMCSLLRLILLIMWQIFINLYIIPLQAF